MPKVFLEGVPAGWVWQIQVDDRRLLLETSLHLPGDLALPNCSKRPEAEHQERTGGEPSDPLCSPPACA
jgi:hypothetical protein